MHDGDGPGVSRRTLLRASAATITVPGAGAGTASARSRSRGRGPAVESRCPDATLRPSMGHCAGATAAGCSNDHPAAIELHGAVAEVLESRYPDAGTLLEAGFKPYFDTLDGDDGWSHWLHPEHIGDDAMLDPRRPESVLVDNDSWRSMGVMFIATVDGEPVEPPPLYAVDDDGFTGPVRGPAPPLDLGPTSGRPPDDHDGVPGGSDDHHEPEGTDRGIDADGPADHDSGDTDGVSGPRSETDRCSPWHYHAGLPGRFAWWFYRAVYEGDPGEKPLALPCRTPCMAHVWTVDHPDGVHAHDGPPAAARDLDPADDPGFDTDAEPGADALGWDVLPEAHVPDERPEDLLPFGPR